MATQVIVVVCSLYWATPLTHTLTKFENITCGCEVSPEPLGTQRAELIYIYYLNLFVILLQDKTKGTTLNLDLTKLEELVGSNANPEHWYIVADKSILLYHLNFLNILINSGNCNLFYNPLLH